MSHLRECPDQRNKSKRDVLHILLRPAMLETLRTMYARTTGATAGLPFETYLSELLENLAAEYRSQEWRLAHGHEGIKNERKVRPGAAYVNAAADLQEQEETL
jgi:hypothetical protein